MRNEVETRSQLKVVTFFTKTKGSKHKTSSKCIPQRRGTHFSSVLPLIPVSYPSIYLLRHWLLAHTWVVLPGRICCWSSHIALPTAQHLIWAQGQREEVEPTAKPGWPLTQGQLFFQRHHGGNAKGQHPLSTHLGMEGQRTPPPSRRSSPRKQAKLSGLRSGDKQGQGFRNPL